MASRTPARPVTCSPPWPPHNQRRSQNGTGDLVEIGVRKDRNRDGFFKRNTHKLPAEIIQMFNKATTAEKRKVVNEVVVRGTDGEWALNLQAAVLTEWNEKYTDVRKDRGLISKPAGLAAQEWGGWSALADAKNRGDVWIVSHNDRDYYQWREFTEIEREGHRGGVTTQGTRKLDVENYKRINLALEKWEWNLELKPKELQDWEGEAAIMPKKVTENLGKVQKACDKAYKESRLVYRQVADLSSTDTLAVPIAAKLKEDFEADS